MSKKRIFVIVGVSLLVILVIIVVPMLLELLIFRNHVPSELTNGEWGSFLGSYIGGVFGGIGTLIAVYITTTETRKIQKNTLEQMNVDREKLEKKERKEFAEGIAGSVARYLAEINKYYYDCKKENRLFEELRNINPHPPMGEDTQAYILQMNRKENIERELRHLDVDRHEANECYFLLRIKLGKIDEARSLLEQLEHIHQLSVADQKTPDDSVFRSATDSLQQATEQFIREYVEQKMSAYTRSKMGT